jgi:hypothetical protein
MEMSSNAYKKAQERLKELYSAIEKKYPYDFEYIGRDVVSALVECDRRGGTDPYLDEPVLQGAGGYSAIVGNNLSLSSISIKPK